MPQIHDTAVKVTCGECHGVGEVAVSGTYDGRVTISPEDLITKTCHQCEGAGQVCICHGRPAWEGVAV